MAKKSELPALLKEIASVIGADAALRLALAHGGTRVHFPGHAPNWHWLPQLIGREAADRLCAHFRVGERAGGISLDLPLGPACWYERAKLQALTMRDQSAPSVATSLGVSERTVYKWRAEERAKQSA